MRRREFLKAGATGVGVVATGGLAAACAPTAPSVPVSTSRMSLVGGMSEVYGSVRDVAVTAAVGLQPASISDFAKGPDMPKVNADPTANSRPSRKLSLTGFAISIGHLLGNVMSKMNFGHYDIGEGSHESNDFQS